MDALLAALAEWGPAAALRGSRWGYAAVNTAHVLGIAVLVGAVLPMDLRLMGAWRGVDRAALVRVLAPVAAAGLALAGAAGFMLFAVRPGEYAAMPLFLAKLGLVVLGAGSAIALHVRHGARLERAGRLEWAGALSLTCWLGALVAGRMIAYVRG